MRNKWINYIYIIVGIMILFYGAKEKNLTFDILGAFILVIGISKIKESFKKI
ncbi:MAG: hypothetical protein SOZ89_02970 [Peptoniphilaceae bacterium]|nr:hypothetical protein [Peptoniphilaceae bacterium]MDD7383924.1 hypothetical protein [Peptoniphilaceae bacterium]MDY3738067.1 hypothetical protein [Peptoniphilaceae bacterium]